MVFFHSRKNFQLFYYLVLLMVKNKHPPFLLRSDVYILSLPFSPIPLIVNTSIDIMCWKSMRTDVIYHIKSQHINVEYRRQIFIYFFRDESFFSYSFLFLFHHFHIYVLFLDFRMEYIKRRPSSINSSNSDDSKRQKIQSKILNFFLYHRLLFFV
jgi:hypothetical protein